MPGRSDAQPSTGSASANQASCFVDTHIWVYAHLKKDGDVRHARALALVQSGKALVISPQVVAEYYNVMLRN
jgi:predicted nucleic acid-binding protein